MITIIASFFLVNVMLWAVGFVLTFHTEAREDKPSWGIVFLAFVILAEQIAGLVLLIILLERSYG